MTKKIAMGYYPEERPDMKKLRKILDNEKIGMQVALMREHPNYNLPTPLKGETQIQFALRCASHLVTPPQFEGEDYEIECTTVRDGVLSLVDDVTNKWNASKPLKSKK